VLVQHQDPSIMSKVIGTKQLEGGKFSLDLVPSNGPPMIYATRQGMPRIAVFGKASLRMPVTFLAMDSTLSISSDVKQKYVTLFYRGKDVMKPEPILSEPDITHIIARLGGEGPGGAQNLNFTYGQVVGILLQLNKNGLLVGNVNGQVTPAAFVLQEYPGLQNEVIDAPVIPDAGRPQTDTPGQVGMSDTAPEPGR
jgi:hypothetical protein